MSTPFKMMPGRGNMPKTGRGIPPTLMSCSPAMQRMQAKTGDDLQAKAQAEANKKLEANIAAKPLEGFNDVRKETATVTNIRLATTPAEIKKWKAGKDQPGAGRFNRTATAEASARGGNMPATAIKAPGVSIDNPKPKLPSTPVQTPKEKNIYTITGTRGYTDTSEKGTRSFVTGDPNRVQKEINFTNKMNEMTAKKYAPATEGSEAAHGLRGKALERRNTEAARRKEALTRPQPTVEVKTVSEQDFNKTLSADKKSNWDSTIKSNEQKGLKPVVYQKKSENKKTFAKKSPAKQINAKKKAPTKMKKC